MSLIKTPWTSQPQQAVEIDQFIKPVLAFNFSQSANPTNLAGKQLDWSNSGTRPSLSATSTGLGASNGAAAGSWSTYGAGRSFDGFSPANSPAVFVFSFVGGAYVNNGSGANIIWSYGVPDSAAGFYAYVSSSSVLGVSLCNTAISGPTLTSGKLYSCVAGRDSSGACWLWVNGSLVASGSGATAADSLIAATFQILGDGTGVRAFSGKMLMFAMGGANPRFFGAQLSNNPWQIFKPLPRRIFVPVSAGTGNGTGTGSLAAITLSSVSGSATGTANATASGSLSTVSLTAPSGYASVSVTASGSFSTVTLGSVSGTATGTSAGNAVGTGSIQPISISAPEAIAIASSVATGGIQSIGLTAPTGTAAGQSQTIARPGSDTSNSGWTPSTGSDLYAMLDEVTPNDADYISTTSAGSVCRLGLGAVADPGTSSGQVVSYRASSSTGNGLKVELMQGGTVIATWNHATLPATDTTYQQSLSTAECDAITDYTALSVRLTSL